MVSSKATVTVQLVRLMDVETRRPLEQVQYPQHHNYSLLRDQPEPVLGDAFYIQASLRCETVDMALIHHVSHCLITGLWRYSMK